MNGGLELVDTLELEQSISAFAVGGRGSYIAVATKTFVAIYQVLTEQSDTATSNQGFQRLGLLTYAQSSVVEPGDYVSKIHFTTCECGVILSFFSGLKKKLCLSDINDGLIDLCDTCEDELDALELNR